MQDPSSRVRSEVRVSQQANTFALRSSSVSSLFVSRSTFTGCSSVEPFFLMPHFPLLLCFTRAATNVFEWLLRPHSVSRRRILSTAISALALLGAPMLPAQESRLSNVAVRASAGGADTLITGFTIGPGPNKQVLVRAVGPTLGVFGVGDALTDPKLELYSGDLKIAENDDFNAADASTFASVGAFALGPGAKDAAIVTTLAPGSYTAQVTGIGGSGVALVEVYEVSGGTTRLVNLSTRAQVGTGSNILIPGITIAPGTGTRRLLLRAVGPTLGTFGVPGTITDPKLELFTGTNKIAENDNWGTPVGLGAADAATLTAAFAANGAFALTPGSRDAALLLNLGAGSYTLQVSGVNDTTGAALVEVYDLTPVNQTGARPSASLYVASLRPDQGAPTSTASGYATLLINSDGTATVNVSFSNLTSTQTSAHLQLGASRDYVLNLARGQVSNAPWMFTPSGAYTTNDLINALNTGNIFVGLDSANFPAGELRGNFVRATGSQTFTPPAAPPPLPPGALSSPTQTDAARFLTQATFGPTPATINALMARGIPGWIDDQMALPATGLHAALRADLAAFPNPERPPPGESSRVYVTMHNLSAAWWKNAVTGTDQLRQRVAFALSQIFVVGDLFEASAKTKYYDLLINQAFGNYRRILEDVTLSPVMGFWLTHVKNQKTDPTKGTAPDENYAREVQQLFSVGLVQLQPDGTLLLDSAGQPIPTYNQSMVSETAKVLTGWSYAVAPATTSNADTFANTNPPSSVYTIYGDDNGWMVPMRHFDAFHDKTEKRILSLQQVPPATATPTRIPANQTGPEDLKILLDTLFNHPNTGPFISRHLIKFLVTSNPSPGYVYRVAQVFANDGTGTRGHLGAVVRAILTDYEARSPDVLGNAGYGKVKEPVLRVTSFLRALNGAAPNGRFMDSYFEDPRNNWAPVGFMAYPQGGLAQGPLTSPTVFNFFSPNYSPPGAMAAAGLVAPELEITDSVYALRVPNELHTLMYRDPTTLPPPPTGPSPFVVLDYAHFLPHARNPSALVEQVNLIFCANQMTAATRKRIVDALAGLPASVNDTARVQAAIQLTIVSPSGVVQR
jgi:uncharacterized protein (DUF1800 family)